MNGEELINVEQEQEQAVVAQPADTSQPGYREPHELAATREAPESEQQPWLKSEDIDRLHSRWSSIQTEFVDDPHASVKQADALVAEALENIEQAIYNRRTALDERWTKNENISTEDLRLVLQDYRSLLNRLLSL